MTESTSKSSNSTASRESKAPVVTVNLAARSHLIPVVSRFSVESTSGSVSAATAIEPFPPPSSVKRIPAGSCAEHPKEVAITKSMPSRAIENVRRWDAGRRLIIVVVSFDLASGEKFEIKFATA